MKRLTLILILLHHSVAHFQEENCPINHMSTENMWEHKVLHDLLKCGYNSFNPPPPNGTQPLEVSAFFVMKSFKFDSKTQEFSSLMWTIMTWRDERLQWDAEKYDGITTVVVSTINIIWAPNIRLINSIGDDFDQRYLFIPCELHNDGIVHCINREVYESKCSSDLRDWPYDAQNCNLEFGLYSEAANKMKLDVGPRAITMFGADYGVEWDIMDYEQTMNETSEKQMIMKFRLERHAHVLAAIVIHPSLILSVLTLSSLFIDARLNLRLLVICFSLLCHNYFITDLSYEIPDNTKDPPRLLMYYRGSLILTSFLIVASFVLNLICIREVVCPNWINSINDFVFLKILKFVIWPRWEIKMKEDIETNNFVKDWTDFANIINSVCILISMIVYVCLYCVFMPQPIAYDYKELI